MTNLGNYVEQNLARFVKMKPGGVVVLRTEVYGNNAPVEETFYTKREYASLMSAGKKRLRTGVRSGDMPVGGGVRKNILAYDIPRTIPRPVRLDRVEVGDSSVNPAEARQFVRDLGTIAEFCSKFEVALANLERTNERGRMENMYVFSDGLGGYTIDAVRKSVRAR